MEAAGVVDLGLSSAEFWELTPRRFGTMMDRFFDREIRHERQTGLLAALYANAHRDEEKRSEPFTIEDFAPALRNDAAKSAEPAFDGPAFLKPCAECGTPKWRGHLIWCKTGERQFARVLGKAQSKATEAQEKAAQVGKAFLEPRK
jgi:hypothetical protein